MNRREFTRTLGVTAVAIGLNKKDFQTSHLRRNSR